jgi:hypothetical protein
MRRAALGAAACAGALLSPAAAAAQAPSAAPGDVARPVDAAPSASFGAPGQALLRDSLVARARAQLGRRYVLGGESPERGFDCSGLVRYVLAALHLPLPRTAAQQARAGEMVPKDTARLRPGDLLTFGRGTRVTHIGIYVGNGKMLHAPHTGDVVKIAKVYDTPTKIRRVVDGAGEATAASSASFARPTALRGSGSTSYDDLFAAATRKYDLPEGLLKAVARAESNFNPRAHSPAGAIGLMQIMPGTARELGVDPSDPAEAVDGAARLLRSNLRQFDGSVRLAVAAYNAGAGAVRRYDGVPPYAETRTYVQRVLSGMERYAA